MDCQLLINNDLPIRIASRPICKSMGHNYEAHVRAYPCANASNVCIAFDDGIERLLKMAKNQKLVVKKA